MTAHRSSGDRALFTRPLIPKNKDLSKPFSEQQEFRWDYQFERYLTRFILALLSVLG